MSKIRRIGIYCGASAGVDPRYTATAQAVGETLARRGITVVYGGGKIGLMGSLADAALAAGGQVIGVMPQNLFALEVGHEGLSELFVVDGMHARKMMMVQLSDAFIALPGGFGTLEELLEVTTWSQMRFHQKPVGLLNVLGYYEHLIAFLDHAAGQGFIRARERALLHEAQHIEGLLAAFQGDAAVCP